MLPERTDADAASDAASDAVSEVTPPAAETPESATAVSIDAAASSADEVTAAAAPAAEAVSLTKAGEVAASSQVTEKVTVDALPADKAVTAAVPSAAPLAKAVAEPDDPHAWDGPSIPFVPHHALTEGVMALAFLTVIFALVATVPADLEARANPFLSPSGVMPEWYLVPPFELLHLVPALPGMLMVGVAVGILLVWPFIDRRPKRISRRPLVMMLALGIIAALVGLSVYSYMHAAG